MSNTAAVVIKSEPTAFEMSIYCHLGGHLVEEAVANGLKQCLAFKPDDAASVVVFLVAAITDKLGDARSIYLQPFPTTGYRNIVVDCDQQTVRYTSIYDGDADRTMNFVEFCIQAQERLLAGAIST